MTTSVLIQKKTVTPNNFIILSILSYIKLEVWEQQDWEVDQEIDGKVRWERMEE